MKKNLLEIKNFIDSSGKHFIYLNYTTNVYCFQKQNKSNNNNNNISDHEIDLFAKLMHYKMSCKENNNLYPKVIIHND